MLIHKAIREQVALQLRMLNPEINVWAGRPTFIDLDNEPTTLAVFIDDAQSEPTGLCGGEWEAILNIAIYQRSTKAKPRSMSWRSKSFSVWQKPLKMTSWIHYSNVI
ncbi:hypothetical protein INT80_06595 [Gallibacterium anatis]|uniref:Uncharacterized protein n=1 Tax=Gallibacterium anatis TaxID=750 RepID=A0A930UUR4_9PAST|nr:hypothetical protein [Gallibacterium anatis]